MRTRLARLAATLIAVAAIAAACQEGEPIETASVVELQPLTAEGAQTIQQAARTFYDSLPAQQISELCANLGGTDPAGFVATAWDGRDRIVFGPDASFPNDAEHQTALAEYLESVQTEHCSA